ncbi:MAG: tRNA (adenosine(37)-N6)-threonylcarbamoyltransferase complex ATPase subunit type 1 TsaE [Planctomycetaceae bacterium]
MRSYVVDCRTERETRQLGARVAAALETGLTIALNGQLGSGKTCLVRAICCELGVEEDAVNSPTFVLMQAYSGERMDVFHFDTYRLADVDEFLAIGAEDYLLDSKAVCLVEWAERVRDVLPADHLALDITQVSATARRVQCVASGPVSAAVLERVAAGIS